jgi:Protein of unknown function (DUF2867)
MNGVIEVSLPHNAAISAYLDGADFADSYSLDIGSDPRCALALYLDIVSRTPAWIDTMMTVRNRIVSLFGLKNLGALSRVDLDKPLDSYRTGDRVGIFSLQYISDDEIIVGDKDRHLDAKVSVRRERNGSSVTLQVSTVVHIHNLLGRTYMLVVVPAHRRIVPAILSRHTAH